MTYGLYFYIIYAYVQNINYFLEITEIQECSTTIMNDTNIHGSISQALCHLFNCQENVKY